MAIFLELKEKLIRNGLKVTPQRVAVLEAVIEMNHPSADQVLERIRRQHPGVSTGTVYHILDSFAEKELVQRVKTDKGVMRYDAILESHHHLYCQECDLIHDYYDEELNRLLEAYFSRKQIENFSIEDIKLQIVGKHIVKNQKDN